MSRAITNFCRDTREQKSIENGNLSIERVSLTRRQEMQDNTTLYVLVGIILFVIVVILGFSFIGAPQYPAGYPTERMTTSK